MNDAELRKSFGAWEAVEAMYELERQGFHNAMTVLRKTENGIEQWLFCDMREDGEAPDIDIDDVAWWADPHGRIPHITGVCDENYQYWWIFD